MGFGQTFGESANGAPLTYCGVMEQEDGVLLLVGKDQKLDGFSAATVPSTGVIHLWQAQTFVHTLSLTNHRGLTLNHRNMCEKRKWRLTW